MATIKSIPGMIRDSDSGMLIRNDKSGRKMPRAMMLAALDRMAAERKPEPPREPLPF